MNHQPMISTHGAPRLAVCIGCNLWRLGSSLPCPALFPSLFPHQILTGFSSAYLKLCAGRGQGTDSAPQICVGWKTGASSDGNLKGGCKESRARLFSILLVRICGCPVPGSVQRQVEWGFKPYRL